MEVVNVNMGLWWWWWWWWWVCGGGGGGMYVCVLFVCIFEGNSEYFYLHFKREHVFKVFIDFHNHVI
jgi:hypothetical protein